MRLAKAATDAGRTAISSGVYRPRADVGNPVALLTLPTVTRQGIRLTGWVRLYLLDVVSKKGINRELLLLKIGTMFIRATNDRT
jgi:hypothetical protein